VKFDVPQQGASGPVPDQWLPIPIGKAITRREGTDITMAGVGVSVHRAIESAEILERKGLSAEVIDLRTVAPLDTDALLESVSKTGRLLAVDEDYRDYGLSGELAARVLESRIQVKYGRVCTEDTIPFSRDLEDRTLPSTDRIVNAALELIGT
jgi:pyruvate dehydrogenase E1 component beta subunit